MPSTAIAMLAWLLGSDERAALFAARVYVASCLFLTAWFVIIVNTFRLTDKRHTSDEAEAINVQNELRQQAKKRSWILTGTAALVSSICSTPFLFDLVSSGLDVAQVKERSNLSRAVVMFFMAYLNMDLIIGSFYYRRNITLLTGWIHHSAYSILCIVVTRHHLTHVFAHAFIMESPTFLLALSMLVPKLRSDLAFNGLFFVTRIAWHAVLLALYWSPYGQTHAFGLLAQPGSPAFTLIPAVGLSLAAPLHVQWFTSSVRGMLKRKRRTLAATTHSVNSTLSERESAFASEKPNTQTSPLLSPQHRPRLVSLASSYLASPRPSLVRMRSAFSSHPLASSMSHPTSSFSSPLSLAPTTRSPSTSRRLAIERQVKSFFDGAVRSNLPVRTQRWLDRSQHDILKAHAVYPITRLRLRAGRVLGRTTTGFSQAGRQQGLSV
ncbi:hypothetical protein ACM66B_002289 [Microbotryomycetes sp. NB124-2]